LSTRQFRAIATGLLVVLSACGSAGGSGGTRSTSAAAGSAATDDAAPPASVVVGDREEWVAFQSLADQFDARADDDGIDHDDTIFLVRTDGSGLHRLPPVDMVGSELRPTWSPDGSQVAFIRARLADDDSELWTINADGTNAVLAYDCSGDCNTIDYPDWGADGGSIYFNRDSNVPSAGGPPLTFEVWRVDVGTGDAEPVLTREDGMTLEHARVAPDGSRVVYVRYRNIESEAPDAALFVGDLGDGTERRLTDWGFPAYPDWSVDGERIVFNTYDLRLFPDTVEPSNIFSIAADGSDLQQLTTFDANDDRASQPRWAPDGTGIVYTRVRRVASDPFGERTIGFMAVDGSGARTLTPEPIIGTHPELRPIPAG
jgi:Tol biopolymer transport system component